MKRLLLIVLSLTALALVPAAQAHPHAEDDGAEVKGPLTALTETSVTVEGPSGPVTCAIPAGVAFPGLATDQEVEIECELVDGALVLGELESKQLEFELDDGVELEGELTLSDASVTVASADGVTITCTVPAGLDLTGFSSGAQAEAECALVDGVLVLQELESGDLEVEVEEEDEEDDEEDEEDEDEDDEDNDDE